MATIEQCDNLLSVCDDILSLESNKESYFEKPEWGELSFRGIMPQAEAVFWMAKKLQTIPRYYLLTISEGDVIRATKLLSTIIQNLQEISNFKISQDNAQSIHSQHSEALRNNAEALTTHIGPWISLLSMRDGEQEALSDRIRTVSDEVVKTLQETTEFVQNKKEEIDSVVQVVRAQSGEAGAAAFTEQFKVEAKSAKNRGTYWLIPAGFFLAAAFALSVLFMLGLFVGVPTSTAEGEPVNTIDVVYGIGGRVIGISVLLYAAVWSGKIALANMHLTSVNKHRAISLETLQAFQNAVDDPTARDAVVLEAARAVYENVPSGYIGRQPAEQSSGGRILELIRTARPQSSQQEM